MFITLLQIFSKFMFHSKVIFIGLTGPDDTGHVDLQAGTGYNFLKKLWNKARVQNLMK